MKINTITVFFMKRNTINVVFMKRNSTSFLEVRVFRRRGNKYMCVMGSDGTLPPGKCHFTSIEIAGPPLLGLPGTVPSVVPRNFASTNLGNKSAVCAGCV
jgi:hypothetical protein